MSAHEMHLALTNAKVRLALVIGSAAAVASGVYAAAYMALALPNPSRSIDVQSVATMLRSLSFVLGAGATLLSFRRLAGHDPRLSAIERRAIAAPWGWLNRLAFSALTGLLAGWTAWLILQVLGPVFRDALISRPHATLATALCGGLVAAAIAYVNASAGQRSLLARVSATLVAGLMLSMLVVDDPGWWRDSLSFMGRRGPSAWIFNVTLVLAGLGLCGLMLEIGRSLRWLAQAGRFPPRSAKVLAIFLPVASIGLMGLGLFPDATPLGAALHKLTGHGALLIFLASMLGLRWIAPPLGRTAHLASALLGGLSLLAAALNAVQVFDYIFFEIIVISILLMWLFLFQAYTSAYIRDHGSP